MVFSLHRIKATVGTMQAMVSCFGTRVLFSPTTALSSPGYNFIRRSIINLPMGSYYARQMPGIAGLQIQMGSIPDISSHHLLQLGRTSLPAQMAAFLFHQIMA